MIIKKYTAKTETEAIEAAKKELGNGIVIMNVKEIKPRGFFAVFKSKLVEATVALEGEQDKATPVQKEKVYINQNMETRLKEKEKEEDTRSIEEKLENLQNLLVTRFQKEELSEKKVIVAGDEKDTAIQDETEEENPENRKKEDEYLRFLKLLYNVMLDNEVDERYANQIIEGLDKTYKPGQAYDQLLANIYQRLILKFGKTTGVQPSEEGAKVVLFFGPTGVGKTTTIAKLASKYSLEEKKKVALMTTDTYRIAAAEQLRTYANILQVPFRVLYTDDELLDTLKEWNQYDYIFVDTTGHSHQNEEQKKNIERLIQNVKSVSEVQSYLVLSITTKYKDLLKIADKYSAISDYELIFTKLDETYTLGNMLNLKLYTGKAIAYVTCGQNVPDDIESFDPQATVKALLGGKR